MKDEKFVINNKLQENEIVNIKHSIHSHDGINAVRFDLQSNTITLDYDEEQHSKEDLIDIINQSGVHVSTLQ